MSKADDAVATFDSSFSCSQSVLDAFAGDFGLDRDTAMKIASGFGGGMGRMASVCGAILALMDAGVPIKAPVAGISCGLVTDGKGTELLLTDIITLLKLMVIIMSSCW